MALDALTGVGRFLGRQHAHERRLADAVGSNESDAIAAFDMKINFLEDDEIAVGLAGMLDFEDCPATFIAGGKIEVNLLTFRRNLDRHDFLEHLDAALDL